MALWVFFGHLELWCAGKTPPWGSPAIAVDVFMLLSGFLMAFHWQLRRTRFLSVRAQTYDFYVRRFFRIAPLYYVLLIIAFAGQSYYMHTAEYLRTVAPPPWAGAAEKTASYAIDAPNVISHFSFLFGLFPKFSSNNVLPDWSIGLEMQFYVLFPLLILAVFRFGALSIAITSMVLVLMTNKVFGLYREPGLLGNYPQPSMILFKLNIFVAGMCMALFYINRARKECLYFLVPCVVSLIGTAPQVQACALFMGFVLYFNSEGQELFGKMISGRVARFLGDTSYSVYLLHKLIMLPVLYLLFHSAWFMAEGTKARIVIAFAVLVLPIYGCAYLIYRLLELPGIQLGRTVLKMRWGQPRLAAVTPGGQSL